MPLTPEEKTVESRLMPWRFWFLVILSVFLFVTFVLYMPVRFLHKSSLSSAAMPQFQLNVITPQPLAAGIPQELSIELKDDKGQPLTDLRIVHERLVHVVIIDEELETLGHVHPEDLGSVSDEMKAQGRFVVQYTFPKPGREYIVAVDGNHRGTHSFALHQRVRTEGEAPPANIIKDLGQSKSFGDYTVSLATTPGIIKSGEPVTFRYRFEKGGQPVRDFEQYLGAPMHVSVVSAELETFVHTHGEVHDPNTGVLVSNPTRFGPDIDAHIVFPHPGLYRIFGQVNHDGKVWATSFMVSVALGKQAPGAMPMGHAH